jgi:hypothetical protein
MSDGLLLSLSAGVVQAFFLIAVSIKSTGAACFWILLWGLSFLGSSFTGSKVFWVRYVERDERERETPFIKVTSHIILGWLFDLQEEMYILFVNNCMYYSFDYLYNICLY